MISHRFKYSVFLALIVFGAVSQAQYKGHGGESVSPEIIKKYAPPTLNPEMTNKLKKMFDVSAPGMGLLSPDKKTMYFSWKVTGQNHIWKIQGPKSFPTQLTSGSDSVSLKDIAPNGKFLIVGKDINGQENPGLYKLDLKSGLISELYRKDKVQAGFSFLTDDSKYLYFTANDKKPDSYSTYKLNLDTMKLETVYDGDGNWYVADQKNNGQNLLFVKYNGARINEYYDFESATKKMTPVIGQNEKSEYDVSFSQKENEYLVLSDKENFKKLYLYKNKELKLLTPKELEFDVSGFSVDHKRSRIMYNVNRGGYTMLYAMDAKTFKPISIPEFKGADHVFSGMTTRDGQVSMLGVISAKSPRLSYSYDWKAKKMTQWVLPSAPEVNLNDFAVAELLSYTTRDGVQIPMFVRFPPGCKSSKGCPVVVHFHGGPEGQSEAGFSPLAQAFVNEGFIFAEPNVRGSDGYGKEWIDSDNGIKREKVITDIEDASIWIKKNWKNSKNESPKIGVMGWSYGGYSTLYAMTKFAGAYNAGVALVGMSNLVSFIQNTAPYRRILRMSEYGNPETDLDFMKRLSPVTYVDQVRDPLMIIQGANDPRVPAGEAIQMHERLSSKKIKSQLIIFADEGHGSSKKENQVLEIGHMIEFFKTHLK
jgi:dipeptidyl aminopeptidase/acylaminoacyl peptidase